MCALKEPVKIDCKKACSVMDKHEYQHFDVFDKHNFNPFHGTGVFLYFLKYIRKPEIA